MIDPAGPFTLTTEYYCSFCEHKWSAEGKSACKPHIYVAKCPKCLTFGFPTTNTWYAPDREKKNGTCEDGMMCLEYAPLIAVIMAIVILVVGAITFTY